MNASISVDALGLGRLDHALRVGGGQRERLLAQDVLAGAGGGDRPLGVEVVRQRDVDGVDVRVGEERLVRAVGPRDAELVGDRGGRVSPSREAIATTSQRAALRMPGMTFFGAMSAVDRIPQRSVVMCPPSPEVPAAAGSLDTRSADVRVWHTF